MTMNRNIRCEGFVQSLNFSVSLFLFSLTYDFYKKKERKWQTTVPLTNNYHCSNVYQILTFYISLNRLYTNMKPVIL